MAAGRLALLGLSIMTTEELDGEPNGQVAGAHDAGPCRRDEAHGSAWPEAMGLARETINVYRAIFTESISVEVAGVAVVESATRILKT